ncbi:hypothetical protein [Solidesulfovibrio sp.]
MPARCPFDADGLHWPGILADIADAAGPLAAHRVAEARGGAPAYFPRQDALSDDHWLVVACGWDAARAIARRVGGHRHDLPLGPLSGNRAAVARAIREGLENGLTGHAVARLVGVDCRTVRRHKNDDDRAGQAFKTDQHRLA